MILTANLWMQSIPVFGVTKDDIGAIAETVQTALQHLDLELDGSYYANFEIKGHQASPTTDAKEINPNGWLKFTCKDDCDALARELLMIVKAESIGVIRVFFCNRINSQVYEHWYVFAGE